MLLVISAGQATDRDKNLMFQICGNFDHIVNTMKLPPVTQPKWKDVTQVSLTLI